MPKRGRDELPTPKPLNDLLFLPSFLTGLLNVFFTRQEYFSLMLTSQKAKLCFQPGFEAGTLFSPPFSVETAPPFTVRNMCTNIQFWDADIMNNRPRLRHIECNITGPNPHFDMNDLPPCVTSLHLTQFGQDAFSHVVPLIPSKLPLLSLQELDLTMMNETGNQSWCDFCAKLPNLQVLRTDYFIPCFADFSQLRVLECAFQISATPIKLPPNLIELKCRCCFYLLHGIVFPDSLQKLKINCRNAHSEDVIFAFSRNWLPRGLKCLTLRGLPRKLGCPPPDWLPPNLEVLKVESCIWHIKDASVFPTKTLHTLGFSGSFTSQEVVDQFEKLAVLRCKFISLESCIFPTVSSLTLNYFDCDEKIVNSALCAVLSLFPNVTSLTLQSNQNILDIAATCEFPKIKTLELLCEVITDGCMWHFQPFPFLENLTCSDALLYDEHSFSSSLLRAKHLQTLKLWPDTSGRKKDLRETTGNLTKLVKTPSFQKLIVPKTGQVREIIPSFFSFLAKGKNDYLEFYFNC